MPVRFARKRLDITPADIAYGLRACLGRQDRTGLERRIAGAWNPADAVVTCLSVRSGLDLVLACVDWPPGSEVIVSAISIPQVATIIREHGFVPVAVDLDPSTMTITAADVRAATTPRTRALLIAQLFGARADLTEVVAEARRSKVMVIEDCAQCFAATERSLGAADVAMYSFGTIKTATCAGGAVLLVADPELRGRMHDRQSTYPRQSRRAYATRLVKLASLLALGTPAVYAVVVSALTRLGRDYDAVVRAASKGFSDEHLLAQLRHQPSSPLLALLAHRLPADHRGRIAGRRRAGAMLAVALDPRVGHLGGRGRAHTHWLFPVVSARTDALVAAGRESGFDLTAGSSTLVALDPGCARAAAAMRDVVYLPAYAGMSESDLRRLARVVNAVEAPAARSSTSPSTTRRESAA